MEIPKAFKSICRYFFRGVEEGYNSGEEILQAALSGLTAEERAVVKQYLDEILDGRYDDDELERIWHAAGAELRIVRNVEGDMAGFLAMLRSAIMS